jgi:lysophospholipase L1-like esterase
MCKRYAVLLALALLLPLGCGGSEPASPPGSGGTTSPDTSKGGSGGTQSGGSTSASGGASGSGGSSSGGAASGGVTSAGGRASGGRTEQGGTSAGGTAGRGAGGSGTSRTGGAKGTGGAGTAGVTAMTGGASSQGGVTAAGGATSGTGGTAGSGGSTGAQQWVCTWTASPYYDSGNQPPSSLSNAVLRQVVHISLGGRQFRFQFSNLFSNGSVNIKSAHIALCKATPLVDSTIDTATDKALTFSGSESVTIAQGKEVWSDPIDFTVANQGNITITTAFGTVPSQVCGHSGSRTTSYLQSNSSTVNGASMSSATKFEHWYYISGIDVMADASAAGVVAIGDSITDGRGTDNNKNNRWTDVMAARLQGNAATARIATMNQGIGATNLIGNSGTAAQARFNRDVLGQSGAKYAIVLDGVNDINGGTTLASFKSAYDDLIKRAHDKGLRIYGGTIPPFGGNAPGYYTAAHESVRQQVNDYIKSGVFDGVVDFDAALTDGGNPPKLKAEYAAWTPNNPAGSADGLHPGPAGYQKMGETVDLTLFTK